MNKDKKNKDNKIITNLISLTKGEIETFDKMVDYADSELKKLNEQKELLVAKREEKKQMLSYLEKENEK